MELWQATTVARPCDLWLHFLQLLIECCAKLAVDDSEKLVATDRTIVHVSQHKWVNDVIHLENVPDPLTVGYLFQDGKWGSHPELSRCVAAFSIAMLLALNLRVRTTSLMSSCRHWEADVILCPAILVMR